MVRNQLANSSLELDRAHHDNLEAEIAQCATQIVLDVERLGLQKLPTGQQHATLLAGQRLHMHRSVQANTHHLCDAAVRLRRGRGASATSASIAANSFSMARGDGAPSVSL